MAENLVTPVQLPPLPQQQQPAQPQQQVKPSFKRIAGQKPRKGDLVRFRYMFWKHDPNPLVLITSQYDDGRIAGINLHNLTLLDMKNLVVQYCNKMISYQTAAKGKNNIARGFRTYKWEAVKGMIVLDCRDFLSRLGVVREKKLLSPNEVAKIRQQIQQQLRRQVNPNVTDLTKYQQIPTLGTIPGKPASIPGIPVGGQPGGGE